MSRNHKDKYESSNPRRTHTIMSTEDANSGKKSYWPELEITGSIRNLSPNIWQLTHLTALYLNDNSLQRIPSEIGRLVHLRALDLSSNKLRSLPAELGDLIYLRELLLNQNFLRVLPYELGKLFQLQVLGLHGNPLSKEMMALYGEPSGTHKLLSYMLDNLQGTTVTQEIVSLLMNDFDFELAEKFPFFERTQFFTASLCPNYWNHINVLLPSKDDPKKLEAIPVDPNKSSAETYVNLPSPRAFKTHLPFSITPQILKSGAKTIYVARNPKDRLVSWHKLLPPLIEIPYVIDFATFWRLAKGEKIPYEPTWKHIKEGWAQRNNPNVLFLFYEEIRADLRGVIKRIADFLGKPVTDEQMERTLHYLDIDNFRNSAANAIQSNLGTKTVKSFVNKGKVSGYKDVITPEVEKEMDQWIEENLRDTDIIFPGIND